MIALLLWGAGAAQAFCGHYVGEAGAEIYNNVSQAVLVMQGENAVLTLANDFEGEVTDFGLVMPVPTVLGPEDVSVLDPAIFARLDQYSAPRLVSYTCDDFANEYDYDAGGSDGGDSGGGGGAPADGSVTVEASFSAGEYDIVVLSATNGSALVDWAADNGFAIGAAAVDLLDEYIAADAYFVAARVSLDAAAGGPSYLSPIQLRYPVASASQFVLPIRLGTLNGKEQQDVILYTINDYAAGSASVSNFPEQPVEDECMWADDGSGFAAFYAAQFAGARPGGEPGWSREYAWGGGSCDPCTGEPPSAEDLLALGYPGDVFESFFTRLHLRYAPTDISQDVVVALSNITNSEQIRYIEYLPELEDRFPICGLGFAEDPGSCDDGSGDGAGDDGGGGSSDGDDAPVPDLNGPDLADQAGQEPKGCAYGCAAGGGGPAGGLGVGALVGVLALVRRRRGAGR
jgi:uncharacterized protein (TIGR03382 family)